MYLTNPSSGSSPLWHGCQFGTLIAGSQPKDTHGISIVVTYTGRVCQRSDIGNFRIVGFSWTLSGMFSSSSSVSRSTWFFHVVRIDGSVHRHASSEQSNELGNKALGRRSGRREKGIGNDMIVGRKNSLEFGILWNKLVVLVFILGGIGRVSSQNLRDWKLDFRLRIRSRSRRAWIGRRRWRHWYLYFCRLGATAHPLTVSRYTGRKFSILDHS